MANMDIWLTIYIGEVVNYMCKYVTKSESLHTWLTQQFFFSSLNRATNGGEETSVKAYLNRLMTILAGERAHGKSETCHLIDSNPLVYSSHACRTVNLKNNSMLVEMGDRELEVKVSVIDAYAKRMDSSWCSTDYLIISEGRRGMDGMNLNDFGQKYCVGQRGKFRNKIVNIRPKTYVQFTPS